MAEPEKSAKPDSGIFTGKGTLEGEVVRREDQKPIAGATVKASISCFRVGDGSQWNCIAEAESETKTLTDGRYSLLLETVDKLPAEKGLAVFCNVEVAAPRHTPARDHLSGEHLPLSGKKTELRRMELEPAYAVEGRVTNEAGKPIKGVTIYVYQSSSHGCFNPPLVGGWPKTDAQGRFLADGMPLNLPSEQRQVAGFFHDNYERRFLQRLASLPRDSEGVAHVEVVLPAGLSISGQVRDGQGAPVPDAKVLVMAEREYEGDPGCARPPTKWNLKTDAKGRYVASGLPRMRYDVIVTHPAHPPATLLGVDIMKDSKDGIDVVMNQQTVLSGKVTLSDGSPAANYELKASQYLTQIEKATRTDENGLYRLEGFAAGLHASFEGFGDMDSLASFKPPNEAADIRVPASVTVTGRLIDRGTGQPIAKPRQVLLTRYPAFGRGFQGNFESEKGEFELKGVWAGDYFLCAQSEGYVRTCRKVTIAADSAALGDVPVHPGITLRGSVKGPQGEPLARAEVFIDSDEFYDGRTVYADTSGVFEFPKLADGVYQLRVRAEGWAPVLFKEVRLPADATVVTQDVVLRKGVKVSGRALDGEKPVAQQIVILSSPEVKGSHSRRPWIQDTNTGKTGDFLFAHVAPGEYAIRCGLEERNIKVEEGKDLRCDFDWPGKAGAD